MVQVVQLLPPPLLMCLNVKHMPDMKIEPSELSLSPDLESLGLSGSLMYLKFDWGFQGI